jgi:metal-responsive CopG/Arc/MetJ family transcriptional regulator
MNDHDHDKMTLHTVKVPQHLWDQAQAAVAERGDPSLSEVIRRALVSYVRQTERRRRPPNQRNT